MSDVSKTNELIAESRKFLFSDRRYGYEDTVEGDLICRLADALEAATRVPVQGEPNDREALHWCLGAIPGHVWDELHEIGDVTGIVDAILAAGFSRATVPDAATAAIERLRNRHRKIEASAVTGDCATEECEHEEECPTEIFEVCSACWNLCESADPYFGERGIEPVLWPCPTVAALDGAPEPEWEYADSEGDPGPHHLTRFSADPVTLASRNENRERLGHEALPIYRRRKAGPWLPVEVESKP